MKKSELKKNVFSIKLFTGTLLIQTHITATSAKGVEKEGSIAEFVNEIISQIPDYFPVDDVTEKYPITYENSMNTVLRQVELKFTLIWI